MLRNSGSFTKCLENFCQEDAKNSKEFYQNLQFLVAQ